MRIRTRSNRRRNDRITLNLASMIDVTFLLLLYFMVTTVLDPQEDRLNPTLQTRSESEAGERADFQPQIIDVLQTDGTPTYRLGAVSYADRAALRSALDALPKRAGVFVRVHDGVSVGFATAAFQTAHDAGFEQVTYVPAE